MSILILPIAGQASRIGGIPKFVLPIDAEQSLLGAHISSAYQAGVDGVEIICREVHLGMTRNLLGKFVDFVEFTVVSHETQTMNETLSYSKILEACDFPIIGLADSAWSNNKLVDVYFALNQKPISSGKLALFEMRKSQVGKLGSVEINELNIVTGIRDKDPASPFSLAWGAVSLSNSIIRNLDTSLPHIGYSVSQAIENGKSFTAEIFETEYFDCGTFSEYKELLNS